MARLEDEIAELIWQYRAKSGKLLLIATVESATGGRIGDKITNVAGSSDYYKGSIIAYNNEVKNRIVGVTEEIIQTHGAVGFTNELGLTEAWRHLRLINVADGTNEILRRTILHRMLRGDMEI